MPTVRTCSASSGSESRPEALSSRIAVRESAGAGSVDPGVGRFPLLADPEAVVPGVVSLLHESLPLAHVVARPVARAGTCARRF